MIQKKNTDVILENTARHGNGKTLILSTNIIPNGFRAPEFNTVDWANSIVILGCSNVPRCRNPRKQCT